MVQSQGLTQPRTRLMGLPPAIPWRESVITEESHRWLGGTSHSRISHGRGSPTCAERCAYQHLPRPAASGLPRTVQPKLLQFEVPKSWSWSQSLESTLWASLSLKSRGVPVIDQLTARALALRWCVSWAPKSSPASAQAGNPVTCCFLVAKSCSAWDQTNIHSLWWILWSLPGQM